MGCTRKSIGDSVILAPTGRVELTNAEAFKDELLAAIGEAKTALIVDMGGLDYISSAGLRSLIIASKTAKGRGVAIGVAGMAPVVKEIFTISRFNLVFPCFETVRDAVGKLAPAALPAFDGGA